MSELVRKVGKGFIFYCAGCKEHHHVDRSYGPRGTPANPTFEHCMHFGTKNDVIPFNQCPFNQCRCMITNGIIYYYRGGCSKHNLAGFYKMIPLNNVKHKNIFLGFATPLSWEKESKVWK